MDNGDAVLQGFEVSRGPCETWYVVLNKNDINKMFPKKSNKIFLFDSRHDPLHLS